MRAADRTYPVQRRVPTHMRRRNIEAQKINNARIACGDVTVFAIPPEATTFAFFNPFRGEIMRAVLGNIM
jgi:hypothetical protein